jgi:ribonuclease BN (tRNA processing enzyme)
VTSQLLVLGSCGAWPEPGSACSCYVVEHAGFRIVVDLGYGTLTRLLDYLGSASGEGIDAVIVTHRHPDHSVDLHGLLRARWFGALDAPRIPLFAAPGVVDVLLGLEDDPAEGLDKVESVFSVHELPGPSPRIGPFLLRSWLLPHWVPNTGVRLEAPGLTLAFTGDCGPDPALRELGRNADLFVVDATDGHQQGEEHGPHQTTDGPRFHMTAREGGEAALQADCKRLLLTHFWPGNDRQQSVADARTDFAGPVVAAEEGLILPLP